MEEINPDKKGIILNIVVKDFGNLYLVIESLYEIIEPLDIKQKRKTKNFLNHIQE